MTDLREKQPPVRLLDLKQRFGGHDVFHAVIETWTYSLIKNEDVFSRELRLEFRAADLQSACDFAFAVATVIEQAHDVHKSNVRLVSSARFHQWPTS